MSCSYDVKLADDAGGTENNIHYDIEFLDGVFTHLAIVDNPRYERANIVFNSKTVVQNGGEGSGNFEHEGRPGEVGGSAPNNEVKSYFNTETGLIELKGDELGSTDDEIKENGLKYFKENYQGKKFDNPELKGILFSRIGLNKLKSNSADIEKIKAIPALKDIIEKGKYQGAENLSHSRTDGIIKFHRINADVSINEHKENMSVLIGEDRDGNRFYNLNNKTYTVENSSRGIRAKGRADEEFSINIITDNQEDFNPMFKNNEIQNWNEADHPRDEAGKFTEKGNIEKNTNIVDFNKYKKEKRFNQEKYMEYFLSQMDKAGENRSALYTHAVSGMYKNAPKKLLEKFFNKSLSDEEYEGIKEDFEYLYKVGEEALQINKNNVQNNKENTDMALIDELKKLITKVENNKEQEMTEKIEN